MKRLLSIAISSIVLFLSVPAMGASDGLSISSKRVKIVVSKDVKAASEKVDVIKKYEVLSRLQKEIEGQLGGFPDSTKAEITITSFRLRSGASGFFGLSGKDVLDATVTVKDKGKQIGRFGIDVSNGRSGKTQPPTRRLVRLIQRFGEKFNGKLNLSMGRMPGFPGGINININRY